AVYTTYGSFERTDEFGNTTGSFSANNVGLMGTYSNELDSILSYGISAKFLTEDTNIEYPAKWVPEMDDKKDKKK
ncbi:MAG: hypothetical protein RI887_1013, partial [Actinomycetota bacterium]